MLNSRSNHPHAVFSAMETIMTLVIDESEDISSDLLSPLLASVRKENQVVSFAEHLLPLIFLVNSDVIYMVHCFRMFHLFRGNWGRK